MKPLEESTSLDLLLAQVSRLYHLRAHQHLEAIGLYRGQPPVLRALWERDGQTHKELAGRLHVTPATMTRMVQRMEKAGFLTRRPDPEDQRISRVYLSEAGRAVESALREVTRSIEAEAFAGLDEDERALLRRLLSRVRENLVEATGCPRAECGH